MSSASEDTSEPSLHRTSLRRFMGLPKRERIGAGSPHTDQYLPPQNPADSVTLRLRKTSTKNGVTTFTLSGGGRSSEQVPIGC